MLKFGRDMADPKLKSAPRSASRPRLLAAALRHAWGRDTSYDPAQWSAKNPAWGQCAVTALVIQDYCGGAIVSGEVNGIPHYWNRLSSSVEWDLTLTQFGKSAHHSKAKPCGRDFILSFPDTMRRYHELQQRVSSHLAPHPQH